MPIEKALEELKGKANVPGIHECVAELTLLARVERVSVYMDRNRWTAKWHRGNKVVSKHIGRCSELTKEEAQNRAAITKALDLGVHYDPGYSQLSSEAIVDAVLAVTSEFSRALDEAGIDPPRDALKKKLQELVEQGITRPKVPVELHVVQESGIVQTHVDHGVTPDRRTVLSFIRDQILAGQELQPRQVAAHFKMSPSSLGKIVGIKPKSVRYGKDVKRVYVKSLLPEIEKLLNPDEKASPPLKPRSWFEPVYRKTLKSDEKLLFRERQVPFISVVRMDDGAFKYTVSFRYVLGRDVLLERHISSKSGLEQAIADFLYENQQLEGEEQRRALKEFMKSL